MFKKIIVVCLCLLPILSHALEIDEKLTLRIVKTSQSRKTILINRGIEDGLVKGDHAKFFLSIGVVARGVVVKLAPTRSVWSIYRLVNADYLKDGQVMKLKITAPVKITKDESRTLVTDDTPKSITSSDPRDLGIPLAQGADDLDAVEKMGGTMKEGTPQMISDPTLLQSTSLRERNKEIYGTLFYSGLGAKVTPNNTSGDYAGGSSSTLFNIGAEFYAKDEKKWYSRFSLVAQYSMFNRSVIAYQGSSISEQSSEYGGGIHWYPLTRPSRIYKIIPYARFVMMLGSVTTTYTPGIEGGTSETLAGSSVSYSVGGGAKYYLHNGFGARAELEYYSRGDTYASDANGVNWTTAKAGPRMSVGFSYRW